MTKILYSFGRRHTIGDHYCVYLPRELKEDPIDKMISGRKGYICQIGLDRAEAYLIDSLGNEKIISFNIEYLKTYIKLIDVPMKTVDREYYANNPNERFKHAV